MSGHDHARYRRFLNPWFTPVAMKEREPRIREIIGDDFRGELPSFEELTGLLNMSARTLRRRLEKEGTSYQRIKDNARRDAAITMLSRQGMTVSEVADYSSDFLKSVTAEVSFEYRGNLKTIKQELYVHPAKT